MTLPKDPFILYSMINMKLRDEYPSLHEFCKATDCDAEEITTTLAGVGFEYDATLNKFL